MKWLPWLLRSFFYLVLICSSNTDRCNLLVQSKRVTEAVSVDVTDHILLN